MVLPGGKAEGEIKEKNMDSETIINVVFKLIGDTEPHGETHIDDVVRDNQKVLTEVIDELVMTIYRNSGYARCPQYSMKVIGEEAEDFLGYLVEEYGLNDFVRKEK